MTRHDFIVSLRDDIGNRNFTETVRDVLDKHEAMRIAVSHTARDHDVIEGQLRINGCQQIDDHETPVIFRAQKEEGKLWVTAVFPCEPSDLSGVDFTIYQHVGQHGSGSLGWYQRTRPATATEYADLQKELESAPYGYRFKVYSRMSRAMVETRKTEARRMKERT